jgi:hypothetical protein
LFLEDNELTGTIPIAVLLGMTSLLALDLDYNNFRGTLSTQLGLLTDLEYLDLNNNAFFGTVPSEIGAISGLGKFYETCLVHSKVMYVCTGSSPKSFARCIVL